MKNALKILLISTSLAACSSAIAATTVQCPSQLTFTAKGVDINSPPNEALYVGIISNVQGTSAIKLSGIGVGLNSPVSIGKPYTGYFIGAIIRGSYNQNICEYTINKNSIGYGNTLFVKAASQSGLSPSGDNWKALGTQSGVPGYWTCGGNSLMSASACPIVSGN